MSEHMTEFADMPRMGGHTRVEYGVIVDNTHVSHGYRLAEVSGSRETAETSAAHYRELEGRPVTVRSRQVYVTDWQPLTTPPAGGDDRG